MHPMDLYLAEEERLHPSNIFTIKENWLRR